MYTGVTPVLLYKWGVRGCSLHGHVIMMQIAETIVDCDLNVGTIHKPIHVFKKFHVKTFALYDIYVLNSRKMYNSPQQRGFKQYCIQ